MNTTEKYNALREFLLKENYEFPFNNYLASVKRKTGHLPHTYIFFWERFYDEPVDHNGQKINYQQFARIVKNSPHFNPNDEYFWYDGEQLYSSNDIYPTIANVDDVVKFIMENNDYLWMPEIEEIMTVIEYKDPYNNPNSF